ncbi:phosphonate C-P lyase system protein PhnH [Deinococcus sp.]|uniref:phosphonate C-P lyase system protein PhnH n=1 Tax=Deinococcus sp. TaxID=47478 RepID=UPI0025E16075|nr:phosphonate C-P lyase system protein PhnH [Deinococcus sp.]
MPELLSVPVPTPAERRNQATFQALLRSLSTPGRPVRVEGDPWFGVALALLDLDVSFATTDKVLAAEYQSTGARQVSWDQADYLFAQQWDRALLGDLKVLRIGSPLAPAESATLLLPAELGGSGPAFEFSGPGVNGHLKVHISGVPDEFWTLRARACRFPLGWDVLLLDQGAGLVMGLPRTTRVAGLEAR